MVDFKKFDIMKTGKNKFKISFCLKLILKFKMKVEEKLMEENLQNKEGVPIDSRTVEGSRKKWIKITVVVFISVILFIGGFYAGAKFSGKKQIQPKTISPKPSPSQTPDESIATPTATINQQPTGSIKYQNYSSWKSAEDDFWRIRFKIPANQSYIKARQRVEPAQIYFILYSYDGGSRRQAIIKNYRLEAKDVLVQEYLTMKGSQALLIEGVTELARAEGLQYLGVIAYGQNLLTISGTKEQASIIKGVLDNLEFLGNPVTNTVECTKFDEHWNDFGKKDNGDYFFGIHFTRKMDESYIKSSGKILVEAEARIDFKPEPTPFGTPGRTLAKKPVAFTPVLSDFNNPPYVQKLTLLISRSEVIKEIGSDIFNQADGISLWVDYRNLKTADGYFCGGSSTTGTRTIK